MVSTTRSKLKRLEAGSRGKKKAKNMSPKIKKGNMKNLVVTKKENISAAASPDLEKNEILSDGVIKAESMSPEVKEVDKKDETVNVKEDSEENVAKKVSKGKNKKKKLSGKKNVEGNTKGKEEQAKNDTNKDKPATGKRQWPIKGRKKKTKRYDVKFRYVENELMALYGSFWVRRKAVPKLEAMAIEKNKMIRAARVTGKDNTDLTKEESREFNRYMTRKKRTEAKKLKLVLKLIAKKEARANKEPEKKEEEEKKKEEEEEEKKKEPVVKKARKKQSKSVNPHKLKKERSKKSKKMQEAKRLRKKIRGMDPIIVKHCAFDLKLLAYLADIRSKLLRSGLQVSEQKRRLKMASKRAERIFKEKGKDFKISDLQ